MKTFIKCSITRNGDTRARRVELFFFSLQLKRPVVNTYNDNDDKSVR